MLRTNRLLNIIIASTIGVFIGSALYRYADYRIRPELYEIQSAPWYTSIIVRGLATSAIILVALGLKLGLKLVLKQAPRRGRIQ